MSQLFPSPGRSWEIWGLLAGTVLRVGILARVCPNFLTGFSESGFIFSQGIEALQLVLDF